MKLFSALLTTLLISAQSALAGTVAESSEQINPLAAGADTPTITLNNLNSESVNLATLKQPTIAVFYRGGWCPYCNRHLKELQGIQQELVDLGYQIVGISPDRLDELQKTTEGEQLKYELLSDNTGAAARAFGIAFNAAKEYRPQYGDEIVELLESASGETHHQLPVPAVFILKNGKVVYSYANPDYSVRLSAKDLIAAAKANQ